MQKNNNDTLPESAHSVRKPIIDPEMQFDLQKLLSKIMQNFKFPLQF